MSVEDMSAREIASGLKQLMEDYQASGARLDEAQKLLGAADAEKRQAVKELQAARKRIKDSEFWVEVSDRTIRALQDSLESWSARALKAEERLETVERAAEELKVANGRLRARIEELEGTSGDPWRHTRAGLNAYAAELMDSATDAMVLVEDLFQEHPGREAWKTLKRVEAMRANRMRLGL